MLATGGASAQTPTQYTLADLERLALESHPALQMAAAATASATGNAEQAGAWMNPTIGYAADEVRPGGVIRGGEHGFFVEQVIPLGSKLRLQREALLGGQHVAEADAAAVRARVLAGVGAAYAGVLAADERLAARTRLSELLREGVTVSQQLYNVGAADRPDLLEAEAEATRMTLAMTRAALARDDAWMALAVAVGRPDLPRLPVGGSLRELPRLAERASVHQAIVDGNPGVRTARARLAETEARLTSAQRVTAPELVVRGGFLYNRELFERAPGGDPRAVGWEGSAEVGVRVPLWNRNRGGTAAARAEVDLARGALRLAEQRLERQFSQVWTAREEAAASAAAYAQEVLPRAEEAYRLYLARYREMAVGVSERAPGQTQPARRHNGVCGCPGTGVAPKPCSCRRCWSPRSSRSSLRLTPPIVGEHGTRVGCRPHPSQAVATMEESERRASKRGMRAPALFIGFPSPMLVRDNEYAKALRRCGIQLRQPRGIVVASAHWHTVRPLRVTGSQKAPPTSRLRRLSVLAQLDELSVPRRTGVGQPGGVTAAGALGRPLWSDMGQGLDFASWMPLSLLYASAKVPIVEVSLPAGGTPEDMMAVGRALAPLRAAGFMIVGTGAVVCNPHRVRHDNHNAPPEGWAREFDDWVSDRLQALDIDSLLQYRRQGPARAHLGADGGVPRSALLRARRQPAGRPHHDAVRGVSFRCAVDAHVPAGRAPQRRPAIAGRTRQRRRGTRRHQPGRTRSTTRFNRSTDQPINRSTQLPGV
jgi:cobalt-zinc-cadmium efflux system outer membrane protein